MISPRRPHLAGLLVIAVLSLSAAAAHAWPAHADSGGVCLSASPYSQWYQVAQADGAGGAFVVWRDDRHASGSNYNYDVYAQHLTAAGAPVWAANGAPVCTDPAMQERPNFCADGAGGLFAVWTDWRGLDPDVYVQHLGATATRLWSAEGYRVSRATGVEDNVSVVPSGDGCIVVWQATSSPAPSTKRLFAQRYNAAGTFQWTNGGVAVPGPGLDQTLPVTIGDGAGGVIVAWLQPTSPRVIRAQRLSPAGVPLWGSTGIAVSDSTQPYSSTFYLRPDGAGGAWLVVHENTLLTTPMLRHLDPDGATLSYAPVLPAAIESWIVTACAPDDAGRLLLLATNGNFEVAQRVTPAGGYDWTPHGLPVTGSDLYRFVALAIVPDGADGAMLVGTAGDTLTGYREVRAQHVLADGGTAWPLDGVALSIARTGAVRTPIAVPSGTGAIAVWPDERAYAANYLDLYAQRIDASGLLGSPTLDVPATGPDVLAFAPPAPNPARAGAPVTLAFALPAAGRATLALYDVTGRHVRTLLEAELPAGPRRVGWDRRDDDGRTVAAGVYFARLEHPAGVLTKRIAVLD